MSIRLKNDINDNRMGNINNVLTGSGMFDLSSSSGSSRSMSAMPWLFPVFEFPVPELPLVVYPGFGGTDVPLLF